MTDKAKAFHWQQSLGVVAEIGLTLLASVFSAAEAGIILLNFWSHRLGVNPLLFTVTAANVVCTSLQASKSLSPVYRGKCGQAPFLNPEFPKNI